MKHLSMLDLDTLAAGLPIDAQSSAHAADCETCRARLDGIRRDADDARATTRYRAGLAKVRGVEPARRWWLLLAPVLVAAVVLLIVWPRPGDETRSKGDGGVYLVRVGEQLPAEALAVGDVVELRIIGEGWSVVAIDEDGVVSPLTAGARFRVAPGDFTLVGERGDPRPARLTTHFRVTP